MTLSAGTRLGPYELLAPLGAGGMGEVYRARDTRLDRSVAVKVLPAHTATDIQYRERFEREARAASALNHPNILTVFDVGREPSGDYLVTELVDGETLRERLERGPLSPREIVQVGGQIADGLGAAHGAGLVHRDLKPDNVMVTRDGRVKILDFGLAKPLQGTIAGQQTRTDISHAGMLVGTVGYMSPEQVRGAPADARSDLFALGVVLYELATGQRAFNRQTTIETLNAILKEDAPQLPEALPAGLRQIIQHCLEKEPSQRFQSAHDVAFALRSFASTTTTSLPQVSVATDAPRSLRTRALKWGTRAAVLAGCVGLGGVGGRLLSPAPLDTSRLTLVPFATSAESESLAALSPDGERVAYLRIVSNAANAALAAGDQVAELVVKSENAAVPTVLRRITEPVQEVFWSSDGERVYYVQGVNLLSVSSLGGEPREEIKGIVAAHVAPDGRTFAVIKPTDGPQGLQSHLWVGPRDALQKYEPAPVTVPGQCFPNVVRFSPDGTKILAWLTCGDNAVRVVPFPPARAGNARPLFTGRLDSVALGGDWLSDSRHIVLSTQGSLWLGDTDDGSLVRVTIGTTLARWPSVGAADTVVFTEGIEDYNVVELSVSGGTPNVLVGTSQYDGSASWAPEADQFGYVRSTPDGDEIWRRHRNDPAARPLLTPRDFQPSTRASIRNVTFSPDGQWLAFLAFSSAREGFTGGVWVAPAAGGPPRQITPKDTLAVRSSWSPDGRSLAVNMLSAGVMGLSIVRVGASEPPYRVPLPPGLEVRQHEWSPTGEAIAATEFRKERGPRPTLIINPRDGTIRRLPSLESPALAWSRDGRTIYGVANEGEVSVLRALDVASGTIKTVARYATRVNLEEEIGNTLRLTLDPTGQSLISTAHSSASDVWLLKGLVPTPSLSQRLKASWWRD